MFSCGAAGVLPRCRCEVDKPGCSVRLPILRGRKGKWCVSDGGVATPKAGGALLLRSRGEKLDLDSFCFTINTSEL